MKAAQLDAIVASSPENFAYVTGFMSPTQPLMRWRHAMAVVTADCSQFVCEIPFGGKESTGQIREQIFRQKIAVIKQFAAAHNGSK